MAVCPSEMFLISSIQTNDDMISIDGYNLIRADHPSDSKKVEFVYMIKSLFL